MEGHQWRVVAGGQRARCEWNQVRGQNSWQRLPICGSRLQEAERQTQVFFFFPSDGDSSSCLQGKIMKG